MKGMIEIGNLKVKRGAIGFGKLECGSLRDSQPVSVPLIAVNGAGEGPTLWVQAAIHGQELAGIEVIRRLVREEVDPQKLNGTILAAPAVNIYAFNAGAQNAPQDNLDANTLDRGDPNRSVSHQLAHLIYTEGVKRCDYFIDLHTNVWPAVMFLPVLVAGTKEVMERTLAMAEAFGGLPICEVKGVSGWPTTVALEEGKPAMLVELLYHGWIDPESAAVGTEGMLNVLKHIGMLDGEIKSLPKQKVPPGWYGREFISCKKGGLVNPLKGPGDPIRRGEVVAIIRDVYGDIIEEIPSPGEGYVRTVLFGVLNQAVCSGTPIYSYLATGPRESFFIVD